MVFVSYINCTAAAIVAFLTALSYEASTISGERAALLLLVCAIIQVISVNVIENADYADYRRRKRRHEYVKRMSVETQSVNDSVDEIMQQEFLAA